MKTGLSEITFDISDQDMSASPRSASLLDSPIAYCMMYIQWEANEIISDELIRNLTLTFATIAIVSTIFIIDLRVSHKIALPYTSDMITQLENGIGNTDRNFVVRFDI